MQDKISKAKWWENTEITGLPKCHIMLDSSEINEKLMKEGSLLPTDSS